MGVRVVFSFGTHTDAIVVNVDCLGWACTHISAGRTTRREVAGGQNVHVVSLSEYCRGVSRSGRSGLERHRLERVPRTPHPRQHLAVAVSFLLSGGRVEVPHGDFHVPSLMTGEVEHLFLCLLAILYVSIFSLVKYFFGSLVVHFSTGLFLN